MVAAGRTVAEAIRAGTYYRLTSAEGKTYAPPAAESPEEVLACARQTFTDVRPGDVFRVDRIIGGTIGCLWIEPAGTITA